MFPDSSRIKTERTIVNLKDKGFKNAYVIGKYVYAGAREKLPVHAHPEMIEICYCDKGEQVYEVGESVFTIKGGDVFITFPNEPHGTADHPEDKGSLYWVQITIPSTQKQEFLGYSGENAEVLINSLLKVPNRHFRAPASVKKLLENVLNKSKGKINGLNRLYIYNQLTSFLLQVIKSAYDSKRTDVTNERMENVKAYIEKNICNELSIALLADRENISESHFKSLFKKEVGITPMDYVLRKKIEFAKDLLSKNSQKKITEVAHQLSFCSSQYFSTVFKKYTGLSPQQFRHEL